MTLSGSRFSELSKRISIFLSYNENLDCRLTYSNYISRLYEVKIQFVILNEYFDPSNQDDPIKTVINDQYYKFISPRSYNYYEVFVEKNTYEIDQGFLFSSKINGNFYRAGKTNSHITELDENNSDYDFALIRIMLDSEVKHYESRVYGVIDAIGTLGGIFEITFW